MKAHHLIIYLLPLLVLNNADAQCKTIGLDSANFVNTPWYGNNQFLTDFLANRGFTGNGSNFRTECPGPRYQLPVRIVVFRDGNNTLENSIDRATAEFHLSEANLAFDAAGTGIHFYLQEFAFIADDEAHSGIDDIFDFNGDPDDYYAIDMFRQYRADGMINIYFVRNTDSGETDSGQAVTPFSNQIPIEFDGAEWSCWVRTHDGINERDPFDITNTLVHELGHVLGNSHTHHPGSINVGNLNFDNDNAEQSSCFQEVVSRTQTTSCLLNPSGLKCEVNGDGLCDTPGDPNMSTERDNDLVILKGVSNAPGCVYSVPNFDSRYEFDRNNVAWNPPVHNIMSYANNTCQDEFSNMQIAIMWNRIENRFMDYFEGDFSGSSSLICVGGGTINFNNPPDNTDISWTATPSFLFDPSTQSGMGTSAFVKAAGSSSSGWGTISFHESDDCEFFSTSHKVWIGTPAGPVSDPTGVPAIEASLGSYVSINLAAIPGMIGFTSIDWWTNDPSSLDISVSPTHAVVECLKTGYNYVYVSATNSCGTSLTRQIPIDVPSGGGGGGGVCCPWPQIVINPNPSPDWVNITFQNKEELETYYGSNDVHFKVIVSDLSGNPQQRGVANKNGLKLNLKHLDKGIYLVKVFNKEFEQTSRLIIE